MLNGQSRIALCASALLFVAVVPLWADFKDGKRAYEQGNYAAALKELKPLAERGNPEAEALLGMMYNLGRGVPLDLAQAEKWYKAAADQGNAQAECQLGSMYLKKDTAQGIKLLKLSAEQGFGDAYLILGLAYLNMNTKDLPRDPVQADMWFRLASEYGDPMAAGQRKLLESHMTPEQLNKAAEMAAAWKPKSAHASPEDDKH
jgi:TPR repeat protein